MTPAGVVVAGVVAPAGVRPVGVVVVAVAALAVVAPTTLCWMPVAFAHATSCAFVVPWLA